MNHVCQGQNDELFKEDKHRTEFLETDLLEWPSKIKQLSAALTVEDCASVAQELKRLQEKYEPAFLTKRAQVAYWDGNASGGNDVISSVFKTTRLAPNKKQFAQAQYIVKGLTGTRKRWLCQWPPGGGKSRIAAAAALIWLAMFATKEDKVHFSKSDIFKFGLH